MKRLLLAALIPSLLVACASTAPGRGDAAAAAPMAADTAIDATIDAAIAGGWRSPDNMARDGYRHPRETLAFFALRPNHTVIEITPGGGWYAEILAPYLRGAGQYIAAVVDAAAMPAGRGRDYQLNTRTGLEAKFAAAPAQFDRARMVGYDPAQPAFGAPASADAVLTFRNVHNWRMAGQAEGMFRGFFAVLKPGGTLGVVEHRAARDVSADDKSGYVGQAQVIAMAQAAGFVLEAQSEVNANPRDPKDHPNGVWTLPPVNHHDAADAAKYQAIGESDRMTLRFRRPAA